MVGAGSRELSGRRDAAASVGARPGNVRIRSSRHVDAMDDALDTAMGDVDAMDDAIGGSDSAEPASPSLESVEVGGPSKDPPGGKRSVCDAFENEFRIWIGAQTSLSKASIGTYCSYLRHFSPALYRFRGTEVSFSDKRQCGILALLDGNLFDITDASVFACAPDALGSSRSYETKRPHARADGFRDDHNRLYSAFRHYRCFLEWYVPRLDDKTRLILEAYFISNHESLAGIVRCPDQAVGEPSRLLHPDLPEPAEASAIVEADGDDTDAVSLENVARAMRQRFRDYLMQSMSEGQVRVYCSGLANFDASHYRFSDTGRLLSDPLAGLTSLLPSNLFVITNPRLMGAIERALKGRNRYEKLNGSGNASGAPQWKSDRGRMHAAVTKYAEYLYMRAEQLGEHEVDEEWRQFRNAYLNLTKNGW